MSAIVAIMPTAEYNAVMEGRHVKAARAMLGMSQTDLCKLAGVSRATLNDLENDTGDPRRSSALAVESALREKGVNFIDDGDYIGVTMPKNRA
ncbi:helix-turn-helix transcriptional regulator [Aminobacter aminovorans]|uniref:helix-turn-helix transcriptional regulator n=1 Tax=Aminobacter aminovorans TaxID=83263 RepID=UPI0028564B00|nr:helix-turn-helix transcriptional regulator [Aminobacter aminovorans]MDR7221677.1 DNA-binding XRE family transcriptional regulator [Aminobacter aminovorans]